MQNVEQYRLDTDGERETVRRCAHDGWERQFKEISILNRAVRAACAVMK